MADRIVLHVGPHKTGSTALQHMLATNRRLLARYGIHYPITGLDGAAHQDVARACWGKDSSLLVELANEMAEHDTVFISSELISALDKKGVARLKSAFGETQVEIIYVIRRLPNLLASHWRELIKHGQKLSFEEYLENAVVDTGRPNLVPPMPMLHLDRLCGFFGSDGLRILCYDARNTEVENYGQDFVDDIFGIGHEEAFRTKQLNTTAPDWQVELGRHMNILGNAALNYPQRLNLRKKLFERMADDALDWMPDFAAQYDAAVPINLSDQTDWIAQEQEAVVQMYGSRFVDPVESYLAPTSKQIRQLPLGMLSPQLRSNIEILFKELAANLDPSPPAG